MGLIITKERLQEAMQTLQKYKQGKARLEARLVENENWWRLRHWEEIKEQGTTELKTKSAWLVNVILSKHADCMDALPEASYLPREMGDQEEAKKLSSIMPIVAQQAGFEEAWNRGTLQNLQSGIAVYGVFWDKNRLNGLGDIAIRMIDPLQLFWEPGIEDIQQSRNVFLVNMEDNELLEQMYPQLKGKLGAAGLSLNRYREEDPESDTGKSAVIDWYYKKRVGGKTVLHFVKFVNDEVLFATEEDQGSGIGDQGSGILRFAQNDKTEAMDDVGILRDSSEFGHNEGVEEGRIATPVSALARNDDLIRPSGTFPRGEGVGGLAERGLYDHGLYPFHVDVLFPMKGSIGGFGYIDLCKDAQRQIDLMNNAIVANAIAAATPRWFKRGDDGVNEKEFADWTKPFVHVKGNIDESVMRLIPVQPLTGNYLGILQSKIEELKETSGNRDVNNGGAAAGVTAASAIAAMQEQSGKLSRDMIKNSYRVVREIMYMCIELVRQFYTAARTFRILGVDGQQEFVRFDNQGLQPQKQGNDFGKDMGMRLPMFDIEVVASKQSAYTKMRQNELALQFFQLGFFNPELSDQALAAVEMMDFKGKEATRQRISQNGGMWQQLQQMQAQMQQMMSMLGMAAPAAQEAGNLRFAQNDRTVGGGRALLAPTAEGEDAGGWVVDRARQQAQEATQVR